MHTTSTATTSRFLAVMLIMAAALAGSVNLAVSDTLDAQAGKTEISKVLRADFRHRPPEMVFDGQYSRMISPLKDILEEAAARTGYSIHWTNRPFARSYEELQTGAIDLVPRTIRNQEREAFVAFLGPIATQRRDILFLVRPGEEGRIQSYEDLYDMTIGVKRGTAYFDRFNQDELLQKIESVDDTNMAQMFIHGRFDTMVILDQSAIEIALEKLGHSEYSYAHYRYLNEIGNYYGMSRQSPHFHIYDDLNKSLLEMVESGRIREIYEAHDLLSELE
ncbi:substrate-binding periplasmic protein [Nitrincola alkalilacustris]|uniref:substrate-binding periplasmic protein n=1 Tax=Nitrincola alkalilacustris TaxID=1571224 RepID=UPI00124C2A88|nr:ABC transporter substrate-binding protein [Nitrincola alkalilacustris]